MPIFDGRAIDAAVTRALEAAGAPADHTRALILTGATGADGGLSVVYVQKLAHGWTVDAEATITVDGQVSARGGVIWTGR